ncbi:outer membrane protein assembly factor BamB family protein [Wenjunlia tyrosinilytica]|uniref:Pyrrolo-quinoline quinone repeat domain-containing protein n=1 Tax=Wenjunlia tyrosinilytica TaxID=1544741 RepID=A0A918DYN1_9ACTN|nr:PQQ-binding-like beta-propeller repeat protein [Wenjunlia tyrosinilytica]GGO88413.1 hypothetical protein GCM10012280_29180 [Wenjunlia tyrosinilytica]
MSEPPQYGYPPQQPWGGPNPYTQPPQQPSAGLPGQARPQPHLYGYPPPRPVPPPNPSPPLKSGRRRILMAVGGVVVALVAAGGVFFVNSSRDGEKKAARKPHDTKGQVAWQAPVPEFSGDKAVVPGTWFTDKVVAKTTTASVTGYRLDSGSKAWSVPVPGPVCAAASTANGRRTAVLYRTGRSCTHLMGIDLNAGKMLWTRLLPKSEYRDGKPIESASVAVAANNVAVAWGEGTKGYRLSDGEPRWGRSSSRNCTAEGFVGGDRLLAVGWCRQGADDEPDPKDKKKDKKKEKKAPKDNAVQYYVRERNPATGNARWKWRAPKGVEVEAVLSTSPVVLGTSTGNSVGPTGLLTLDDKGEPGVEIDLGKNEDTADPNKTAYKTGCSLGLESCVNILTTKDTVYLPTNDKKVPGGTADRTNEIVAVDLSTGAERWREQADPERTALPVGTADGDPVVYLGATGKQGGKLLRLDPKSGKKALYQQNPDKGGTQESQGATARKHLHDGRLYLVHETLDDTADKLITAYK